MFTQCPECSVAFQVTAAVLRQAAGKVRCGGCGIAFNALEYLSEEKPAAPPSPEPEADLPELTPETPGVLEADTPPTVISAEQSAALLKTLDQLAGEDIRIEDTGIEWRVLGADDEVSDSGEFDAGAIEVEETSDPDSDDTITGSMRVLMDDDADDSGAATRDDTAEPVTEAMRFDDNTPLPDDFDFESAPVAPPEPPLETVDPEPSPDDLQVDLALGEPDEWQDLLGEFDDLATDLGEADADPPVAYEPDTGIPVAGEPGADTPAADEPEADAGTASSGIAMPDMDTQFAQVAESMGIDLSGTYAGPADAAAAQAPDDGEAPVSDDAEETSIDDDLIAAAFETEASQRREIPDFEPESTAELQPDVDPLTAQIGDDTFPSETDDQGVEGDATAVAINAEAESEGDAVAAADEAFVEDEDAVAAADEEQPEDDDVMVAAAADPDADDGLPQEFPVNINEDEAVGEELADDLDFEEPPLDVETELAEREHALRNQLEQADNAAAGTDAESDDMEAIADETFIPELSEEEKTVNMLIDQDLLAFAVEDEHGFASTIVQKQPGDPQDETAGEAAAEPSAPREEENPLVETIIMEGELVHGALDLERQAANREAMELAAAARSESDTHAAAPGRNVGLIAAAIGLVVLLGLQYVHFSREALATVPAVNNAIGPVYRALGMPVSPAWNITGWRFEATKGSTDDAGERLTIYSRIGNTDSENLPLPLIHVSLTDRFEEVVGSRIMEPAEFVVDGADPRQTVAPGGTFNAVIVIESPSPEVTGFKLNVCYRTAGGQLKCEIEDFK